MRRALQVFGEYVNTEVEFVIAERERIPGDGIRCASDEDFPARSKEKRSLPAVACVEREHVRVRGFFAFDFCCDARVAAKAGFVVVAGGAALGHARRIGVRVVGVQDDELERFARRRRGRGGFRGLLCRCGVREKERRAK